MPPPSRMSTRPLGQACHLSDSAPSTILFVLGARWKILLSLCSRRFQALFGFAPLPYHVLGGKQTRIFAEEMAKIVGCVMGSFGGSQIPGFHFNEIHGVYKLTQEIPILFPFSLSSCNFKSRCADCEAPMWWRGHIGKGSRFLMALSNSVLMNK
jgi:hypothetical protein